MRHLRGWTVVLCACVVCGAAWGAPVYITGVPDWDQPVLTPGGPAVGSGWEAWCVPTATANIMGYYRDLDVTNAIADGQVFPNTAAWNAPAGDFQDDTADPASGAPGPGVTRNDIGWYMNTNDIGQTPTGGVGGTYIGTMLSDVKPGLDGVRPANPAWKGYLSDNGVTATVTNAAIAGIGLDDTGAGFHTVITVWPRIVTEIDAGRPVLIHFLHWGLVGRNQDTRDNGPVGLSSYDFAFWGANPNADQNTGESYTNPDIGHTVTLVGYWTGGNDPTNPFYNDDNQDAPNAVIVHDNNDGYLVNGPLPLVLPFDASCPWVMNTEITLVPEPATMMLALVGAGSMLTLRRRRRR